MKYWKQKAIVSGIMVAIGVIFIFRFGFVTTGNVWIVGAVLIAWMK